MTGLTEVGLLLFTMYFKIHSASFITYNGNEICGQTVHLGKETFAVQINYFTLSYKDCWANIKPSFPYSAVLRLKTIEGRCDSHLIISEQSVLQYIPFCDYYSPSDYSIDPYTQITIYVNHSSANPYQDQFNLIIYAYLTYNQRCESPWYRCMNERCLHRDLYCDTDYSYCRDGRVQNCYNDITESSPSSFGNIVGVLALIITLLLVIIVVFYFCCCRVRRRFNQSNNNNTRPRTARDVYVIPTSHDNPDGVDYVIDYQKFAEPPAYESLEMTILSSTSIHGCTDEPSSSSQPTVAESHFSPNQTVSPDSGNDGMQTDEIIIERGVTRLSDLEESIQIEGHRGPQTQRTIDHGNINDAFDPNEDELPTYTDVLTHRERFGLN